MLNSGSRRSCGERVRYLLEERGFDLRNVRAVTHQASLAALSPLDARRKLEVLPEFTDTSSFRQLATLFKRVQNIARELPDELFDAAEADASDDLASILTEPAERSLLDELERRRSVVDRAVETGLDYRGAFAEASKFGPSVDRFFTDVFVMVDDASLRRARLRLMKRLGRTVEQLGDISEIVPQDEAASS